MVVFDRVYTHTQRTTLEKVDIISFNAAISACETLGRNRRNFGAPAVKPRARALKGRGTTVTFRHVAEPQNPISMTQEVRSLAGSFVLAGGMA